MTIYIPKIHDCITCINSFIAYYKNDLEVCSGHFLQCWAGLPPAVLSIVKLKITGEIKMGEEPILKCTVVSKVI